MPAAVAIGVGLITLLGLLMPGLPVVGPLTDFLIRSVVVIAAVALIIGVLNLLSVHLSRVGDGARGWPYSLVTVLAALAVIGIGAAEEAGLLSVTVEEQPLGQWIFQTVQVTVESALGGILFFSLLYAAFRVMRRKPDVWLALFVLVIVIVLIGWSSWPLPGGEALKGLGVWLGDVPAEAGARGILLGIALGSVAVAIRALIGQDRSYRR